MTYQRERNAIQSECRLAMSGSFRFAIRLAYDGSDYLGFQSQPHGNTIQDQIEIRLRAMLRRNLRIFGWGRTDTGVHASGAVITVDLTMDEVTRFSKDKNDDLQTQLKDVAAILCSALKEFRGNQRTGSITATAAVPVPPTFDARFSCLWKRYVYCISCGHQNRRSPFLGRFAWQLDQSLDIDSMLCAARELNGKHNFQWLSKVQKGELRSPIKTLGLTLEKMEGSMFQNDGTTILKVSGTCDFFLYNMMRRIVGVLVSIGQNQATLSALESYLKIQDEEMDGDGQSTCKVKVPPGLLQTAPANGLCLEHIEYDVQIWEEMDIQ